MAAQPPTTLAHRVVWALSIFATKAVLRCSTTSTTVKNLEKLTSLVTSNRQRPLITVGIDAALLRFCCTIVACSDLTFDRRSAASRRFRRSIDLGRVSAETATDEIVNAVLAGR
jgi:hypothetical protein